MNRLLSERVHSQRREIREEIGRQIRSYGAGLNISSFKVNFVGPGWVDVEFGGEDEEAFDTVLRSTFGFAKASIYDIRRGDHLRGFISERDSSQRELCHDVGISEPHRIMAGMPTSVLRAMLCDGRPVSMREIMDAFALWDGIPVGLRVREVSDGAVDCCFSDTQMSIFDEWRSLPLERLIVVGATHQNVTEALEATRLTRDIAKVETLSITVQAAVAKIGTQARGLIRPLGRQLKDARFYLFDPMKPRRILTG